MQFVQANIWLILLVVVSGLALLWQSIGRLITGAKDAGVVEATQLINRKNAVVVDVREDKEFAAGHIVGARHIPLSQLGSRVAELEKFKSRPVLTICRSGARSAAACGLLRKKGFSEVYNLRGGMVAWEQANMPVEK